MSKDNLDDYLARHYIHRSNWLRAVVLGANDGILSTSSLAVGVAVASVSREPVLIATVAGIVAGALSMATGEYVSVSSQTDIERADIERERLELQGDPEGELAMLAQIYEKRGLSPKTARLVAEELTAHNALDAHVKDELGISQMTSANPLQAGLASAGAFLLGGALPLLVVWLVPFDVLEVALYVSSIIFLAMLGAISAKTGGAKVGKAVVRLVFLGTLAMGVSALVGQVFGVQG